MTALNILSFVDCRMLCWLRMRAFNGQELG